jgi:hypothetical protein
MLEHKQVYINCPWSGEETGIDEDIVELMKELWRLGIKTTTCCQDASRGRRPGYKDIWIDFECDSFPVFAKAIVEIADVEWHIMPRQRRTTGRSQPAKYHKVVGVSFPSQFYDKILSYFKKTK